MSWLTRIFHRSPEVPPPIQAAIDAEAAARGAITEARDSVETYWQTRRDNAAAADQRVIEGYRLAERRRRPR